MLIRSWVYNAVVVRRAIRVKFTFLWALTVTTENWRRTLFYWEHFRKQFQATLNNHAHVNNLINFILVLSIEDGFISFHLFVVSQFSGSFTAIVAAILMLF